MLLYCDAAGEVVEPSRFMPHFCAWRGAASSMNPSDMYPLRRCTAAATLLHGVVIISLAN